MITAITPTGDRPLAISLLKRWVNNQARKPDQWVVVDDGKKPIAAHEGITYVRREPKPNDPRFTLSENLRAALPHIRGDIILILEDDEYYAPNYIAEVAKRFRPDREVVGPGRSRYYHLPSGGYMVIGNMGHASLAQTAFRKSFVPTLKLILKPGKLYIDFAVWQYAKRRKSGHVFYDAKPIYVGIKGLPGRTGIGRGHDRKIYRKFDTGRSVLKQWMPRDYQTYLDLIK